MKKNVLFVLLAAIAVIICSCKGDKGTPGTPAADGPAVMMFQDSLAPYSAYNGGSDALIESGSPAKNFGACNGMAVGYNNAAGMYAMRALVKFDITPLSPSTVTVTKAYLTMYCYAFGGDTTVTAYALSQSWAQGAGDCTGNSALNVTWNNYDTASAWTPGGAYDAAAVSTPQLITDPGVITFELNAGVVQNWLNNPSLNYGLILKGTNESTSAYVMFSAGEVNMVNAPKLTIYYRLP